MHLLSHNASQKKNIFNDRHIRLSFFLAVRTFFVFVFFSCWKVEREVKLIQITTEFLINYYTLIGISLDFWLVYLASPIPGVVMRERGHPNLTSIKQTADYMTRATRLKLIYVKNRNKQKKTTKWTKETTKSQTKPNHINNESRRKSTRNWYAGCQCECEPVRCLNKIFDVSATECAKWTR